MERIVKTIWLLALGVFATACITDENILGKAPAAKVDEGMVKARFRLYAPTMPETRAVGTTYTYGMNYDNNILSAWLMVLKQDTGGGFVFDYYREINPEIIVNPGDGGPAEFNVDLVESDTPVKFLVVANTGGNTTQFASWVQGLTQGLMEDYIRNLLTAQYYEQTAMSQTGLTEIPMSGEKTLPSLEPIRSADIVIPMTRSMARIHVTKDLLPDSSNFDITGLMVGDMNERVQFLPNLDAIDPTNPLRVVKSSIDFYNCPYTDYSGSSFSQSVTDGNDGQIDYERVFYVPESPARGDQRQTVIVVQGEYSDPDDPSQNGTVYYRMDFGSGDTRGQILRNYQYTFNIRKVTAAGWVTWQDAAANPAGAIEVDATVQAPFEELYYLDPDTGAPVGSIKMDKKVLVFNGATGAGETLTVTGTKPLNWWLDGATDTSDTVSQSNGYVEVGATGSGNSVILIVTALQENNTGAPRTGKIYVSMDGGIAEGYITWTQESL